MRGDWIRWGGAAALAAIGAMAGAEEEPTQLIDMVVTGTRTEKKLSDVPVRTELIKRAEIVRTAARTLADAVEYTPGVRVENNCQNCDFSQLRLLGLEGPYTQILIDGQPLVSSLASVYGVEHIPARAIDRIEIVKGGASALYGPGAVGGVVNVISRDPTRPGAEIEGAFESIDGEPSTSVSGYGDMVTDDGMSRVSIYGQVDSRDPYDRNDDGFSDLGVRDFKAMGFRARHFFSESADITLDYTHVYEDRQGGDNLDQPEIFAEIAESVQSTRDAGNLTWSHAPGLRFDYRLTAAVAYTERDTYYGAGMDPNAFGFTENPFYSLDSQFNHYWGRHTATWGVQYTRDELTDEQPAYDRITDEAYSNYGFYLQDDWAVRDEVSLVVGGRIDKSSEVDDAIFSPRLALRWSPQPALSIRAAYSQGFRAPQVFDEDLHIELAGGNAQIIRNADDLEEEKSRSGTLGLEWTPRTGPGFSLVEVNGFYTDLDDTFVLEDLGFDPRTGADEFLRVNGSGSEIYGAEFNLGFQVPDEYELRLGWVLQRARFDEPEPIFGSRDYFRTPESYGTAQVTWNAPGDVDLFLGAIYTGEMKVPHFAGFIPEDRLETSESFLTIDASMAKTFAVAQTDLTLALGVKNLTDDFQDDLDEGPERDAGYVYGPRFPRTVYVSARLAL